MAKGKAKGKSKSKGEGGGSSGKKGGGVPLWGYLLLILGAILLLQNFDVLPWGLWGTLWRFWPALLVVVGINIVIGRHHPRTGTFLILLVLGICLGLAIWQYDSPWGKATDHYSAALGETKKAEVDIDFGAGDLNLAALSAGSLNLVESSSGRHGIEADVVPAGNGASKLSFTFDRDRWAVGCLPAGGGKCDINLNREIPLTLKVNSATSDLNLDLSNLRVSRFDVDMAAGNCTLTAPSAAGVTEAVVEGSASNIEITIPFGVAARIEADVKVSALEISESRFPKSGAVYVSPAFETSANRLLLKLNCNAGRVVVK